MITLLIAALITAVLSTLPKIQNMTRSFFTKDSRVVLAKINAFFGTDQTEYLILKIKDSYGLEIEIYEIKSATSQQIFQQKFDLTEDSDAYITLDKNTTNLALSDVDKDGHLDIL